MSESELTLKKIETIRRHKNLVQSACDLLGSRLIERGEIEFGVRLIALGYEHDLSKFDAFERAFLMENDNKETLKLAVHKHNACNRHHVLFWGGIEEMPRMFLAELVCDLFARSAEFGTNLRDYIKEVFVPKHKINLQGKVYKTIKEFVDLLLDKPFVEIR